MLREPLDIDDGLLQLLSALIHERCGLCYEKSGRALLSGKLADRLRALGLASPLDYYYLLKYDPAGGEEWARLLDTLTVRETYFWREPDQLRALADLIVPALIAARPAEPLRIWSAACATGEEPLSIAMALQEAGWFERLPITIAASDISVEAIERARAGRYPERSLRHLPARLRERFFSAAPGGWQIDPGLHRRVEWSVANLIDPAATAALARASVIFCRNVFIYFSEQAIAATVRRFAEQIERPGYLCIGVAESLLRIPSDFELAEIGDAFVYLRRG